MSPFSPNSVDLKSHLQPEFLQVVQPASCLKSRSPLLNSLLNLAGEFIFVDLLEVLLFTFKCQNFPNKCVCCCGKRFPPAG